MRGTLEKFLTPQPVRLRDEAVARAPRKPKPPRGGPHGESRLLIRLRRTAARSWRQFRRVTHAPRVNPLAEGLGASVSRRISSDKLERH